MEFGLQFAETGHLAFATLHANNANQALDRIINFFSEERKQQLLMDLSANLRALISQRLIKSRTGEGRVAAIEILLNSPLIKDLILKGELAEIKPIMTKSREIGMQTFDQALFDLYEADQITYDDALRYADSQNELRLRIKLEGKAAKGKEALERPGPSIARGVSGRSRQPHALAVALCQSPRSGANPGLDSKQRYPFTNTHCGHRSVLRP